MFYENQLKTKQIGWSLHFLLNCESTSLANHRSSTGSETQERFKESVTARQTGRMSAWRRLNYKETIQEDQRSKSSQRNRYWSLPQDNEFLSDCCLGRNICVRRCHGHADTCELLLDQSRSNQKLMDGYFYWSKREKSGNSIEMHRILKLDWHVLDVRVNILTSNQPGYIQKQDSPRKENARRHNPFLEAATAWAGARPGFQNAALCMALLSSKANRCKLNTATHLMAGDRWLVLIPSTPFLLKISAGRGSRTAAFLANSHISGLRRVPKLPLLN